MGGSTKIFKANNEEMKKREERIATLEQQIKDMDARYDERYFRRNQSLTTQYQVDKQGKQVSKAKVITPKTTSSSGSSSPSGSTLKISGTGTNLG
tara:strand:- start:257 stop:541 length:285 start_codon:yes stop_codon:yes gene_type:complete